MKKRPLSFIIFSFVIVAALFLSCNKYHSKAGVEAAMQHYDRLIKNLDADSIALLFTADGDLGGIAKGRDSIRKFLSSFKNIRVLSQSSTTTSIILKGDSSIQKGTYQQTDLLSGKDTIKVKGEYIALWKWNKGWYIKKMATKSIN